MQTKAIVIKKENTNEYDQWVTCYTEEFGKLKTVAKSILKPSSVQSLHLDIFNLVEFDLINGRGMPIVTGAQVINSFGTMKSFFAKTAVAYFFAEAIDKMVFDNDKDDELWSFLVSLLVELNKADTSPVQLFRQGQSRLLDILGYLPETNFCKICDDKLGDGELGAFNQELGGIVCKKCFLSGHGGILISRDDFRMLTVRNDGGVGNDGADGDDGIDQFEQVKRSNISNNSNDLYAKRSNKRSDPTFRRSVLDGMFEYISGNKFSSLELINMVG
ncbi:MAG: DNA repair protein RecO [Candidatus Yanofskybacteria bacterium]|nr:DNA repair protein RecO [Candidatus Yanofskybacteria bacterium]